MDVDAKMQFQDGKLFLLSIQMNYSNLSNLKTSCWVVMIVTSSIKYLPFI